MEIPGHFVGGTGPFWLAFSGYLAGTRSADFAKDAPVAAAYLSELVKAGNDFSEISKLEGAFTALLVAPDRNCFWLARDRLGGRLCYYIDNPNCLAASTHLAQLTQLRTMRVEEDPSYLASFFNLQISTPDGHSPLRNIHALRPGETVECNPSGARRHRQPFDILPAHARSESDWIENFHELFGRTVKGTLSQEHDCCVMLSGGLDSGPIAAVGSRLRKRTELSAISWSLAAFPSADELNFAQQVAERAELALHVFDASDRLPFNDLRVSAECPTYHSFQGLNEGCYEIARNTGYTVILNGASGDLLYPHPEWFLYELLRTRNWSGLRSYLRSCRSNREEGSPLFIPAIRYAIRRTLRNFTVTLSRPGEWLEECARSHLADAYFWPPEATHHPVPQYAAKLLDTGFGFSSSQEYYNAERFGLQRRDPFVSQALIELMLSMPFSLTRKQQQTKWIMREAMRNEPGLPESIRRKPRTGLLHEFHDAGFWHNSGRLEDLLMREHTEWQTWVKREAVTRAFDRGRSTRRDRILASTCIGYVLWREEIRKLRSAP